MHTMALDPLAIALLLFVGVAAGFLNVLAGGGSLLTVPLLIFTGLPATVANGTSRIALLVQNATAIFHYHRAGRLDGSLLKLLLPPTLLGAAAGAAVGTILSDAAFKAILGWIMLGVAVLVLVNPKGDAPAAVRRAERPPAVVWLVFLGIGFYGGMVQAGVGYLLLASLTLLMRQDLVSANILKVVLVGLYTPVTAFVFFSQDKIHLASGLVLALGQALGAWLGASAALKKGAKLIRLALAVAVVVMAFKLLGGFSACERLFASA